MANSASELRNRELIDTNKALLTTIEDLWTLLKKTTEQNSNLEFLLEHRPSAHMTDEQLEELAPWNENVRKAYGNDGRKEDLEM